MSRFLEVGYAYTNTIHVKKKKKKKTIETNQMKENGIGEQKKKIKK